MATIFSRIIAGEIPCYKVAEDDRFFAFLDINPLVKGHTLVIPKQEVDYIFDLNDEDLAAMHVFAKRVALAIGKAFPCRKVGEAVLGLEVPHAHIHLIPMQNEKDMLFSNPKLKLTDEEFKAVAEAIRAALSPGYFPPLNKRKRELGLIQLPLFFIFGTYPLILNLNVFFSQFYLGVIHIFADGMFFILLANQ